MTIKTLEDFNTFDGNYTRIRFSKNYENFKLGDTMDIMACDVETASSFWSNSPWGEYLEYEKVNKVEYEVWAKMKESRFIAYTDKMLELIKAGKEPEDFWFEFGGFEFEYQTMDEVPPALAYHVETITKYLKENKLQQYREIICEICGNAHPLIEGGRIFEDDLVENSLSKSACGLCYENAKRFKQK